VLEILDDWAHPSINFADGKAFGRSNAWLLQVDLNYRSMVTLLFGGCEAGQYVCSFVVLSRYMLDDDFIEFGYGVVDRVVVALEEGLSHHEFVLHLTDYQLRVALACHRACPEIVS